MAHDQSRSSANPTKNQAPISFDAVLSTPLPARAKWRLSWDPEAPERRLILDTTASTSADRPGQSSSAVDAIMRPRSVAIVGVSAKPGSAGRVVLELLHNNKFGGPIHVVGRSTADIEGHKVLTSIDEIPENVDLAVLTLPAASVREAVEGCVRRKVKAAVIFASGFAEVGSDGNSEQDRIGAIARAGGLALVGPNCLGLHELCRRLCGGVFLARAHKTPAGRYARRRTPLLRRAAVLVTIWKPD